MNNKTTSFLLGVIILVIVAVLVFTQYRGGSNRPPDQTPEQSSNATTTLNNSTTTATTTAGGRMITYLMSDVIKNGTTTNCWTVLNNKVYDLTPWIAKHPGGQKAILGLCGRDGTADFMKQHGSNEQVQQAVANFQIGILTQP